MHSTFTRRRFLGACSASAAAFLVLPRSGRAQSPGQHPTPRPGITGANVLASDRLADTPKLIPLFDSIRQIPEVVDGIRCQCGCANPPTYYSLLSCYEGDAMARDCRICQGQGNLVVRLHKEGQSLDQIRAAIDAKFG
jgi:hypothetical protein